MTVVHVYSGLARRNTMPKKNMPINSKTPLLGPPLRKNGLYSGVVLLLS